MPWGVLGLALLGELLELLLGCGCGCVEAAGGVGGGGLFPPEAGPAKISFCAPTLKELGSAFEFYTQFQVEIYH